MTRTGNSMSLKWRKAAAIFGALILLYLLDTLTRAFSISFRLGHDSWTEERFKQTIELAKPTIEALERYRARHSFYPVTLSELIGEAMLPANAASGYKYRAEPAEYIYTSPACEARWRSEFQGWIMKSPAEVQRLQQAFLQQCVSGYRQATLQSPDFGHESGDPLPNVDRWAYYSTFSRSRTVGWCSHETGEYISQRQDVASNGKCR
ncbi:hypothetical protein [Methylocystis heyeri]|uniref:Uncharacterized protein n=1 Tax=Methylocystis heyeri TaxID=391905 RepID=A0A6B8KB29_9HYPH|nr:hypothetical protein [Methylocystis heyeri]QGM44877.1 hypothetical protein H2LOC_003780 [Methylocystis heyeri]